MRVCSLCGARTTRIKGRRKKDTMPAPLYDHKELRDECDALWRQLIHEKAWDRRCKRCGKVRALQAAHCIGRGRCLATRHEPDNGLPLCATCHRIIDSDPEEKRDLFIEQLGAERYARLRMIQRTGGKVDLRLVKLALLSDLRKVKQRTDLG